MQPTGAFAPPTLGLGATLRCKPLNRLAWRFVGAYMDGVYRPIVANILRRHACAAMQRAPTLRYESCLQVSCGRGSGFSSQLSSMSESHRGIVPMQAPWLEVTGWLA